MKLQWTRLLRQRLGLKLALVATTVPVVVLLLFGRLLVESDRKAFRAAYQDRAVTIARITASALREPVVLQDWSVIDEFVSTTVGTEEGLAFAYVRRADGKRVAGRGLEGVAESVLSGAASSTDATPSVGALSKLKVRSWAGSSSASRSTRPSAPSVNGATSCSSAPAASGS